MAGPSGPAVSRTVTARDRRHRHLQPLTAAIAVLCGVLGLVTGSFLNVVIYRVPRRESVVRPRSQCPACGTQLAARDNVPVISWLVLRRRCRTCGARISARYPAVEVLTAVAFAAVGARFGADWALPAFLVFTAALVAVTFIDLEHMIVPNRIVAATLLGGGALLLVAAAAGHEWGRAERAVIGAIAFGAFLMVMNLISPRWMGMGDVKLALVLGLFLGWLGLGHVGLGLFLGFLFGSVGGVLLIATGVKGRRDHIPFAPFLATGAYAAVLVGRPLLDWYLG
jgi:leader peptidase (prepilin peptidase)/N-methyltransferase